MELIRLLRGPLRRHRRATALVVLLQLIQTSATLVLPRLNADLINVGVVRGDTGYVMRVGAVMLALTLGQILAAIGAVYFGARISMEVAQDLRRAVFDKVSAFSVGDVGRFGTPSLITRTTNDVLQVQMFLLVTLTILVPAPVMALGGMVLVFNHDVLLSSLLLVFVPVLLATVLVIMRRLGPLYRSMQGRIDQVNGVLREQIIGIRVVRAFVRDRHEQARFARANVDLTRDALRTGQLMALIVPTVMLLVDLTTVAVVGIGGRRVGGGEMQIGDLIAFLNYLTFILTAAIMATFMLLSLPRAQVCAERIREVLEEEPSIVAPSAPVTRLPRPGHLELRAVGFSYDGAAEPVLRGVDLACGQGETTAIVGSTGSGKTTLLYLALRLFDPTEGEVLVGGVDIRELDRRVLTRAIGVVPQKPYLFSGTIASNLRYGNPDATEQHLWHALEVAQARPFVERLADGLDAPVGQGGGNFSGGERQRLSIARLLVARPAIYLFDDSFSALDYTTDAALREALAAETGDANVVIVAQRVATIRNADRIVVLDQGRVVGVGRHPELLERNQTYQEIVRSQLTAAETAS